MPEDLTDALISAIQKKRTGQDITVEDVEWMLEGIENARKERPDLKDTLDMLETCFSAQKKRLEERLEDGLRDKGPQ
jgi:predicted  nucleic acid-binding Zn-ribbon protein